MINKTSFSNFPFKIFSITKIIIPTRIINKLNIGEIKTNDETSTANRKLNMKTNINIVEVSKDL